MPRHVWLCTATKIPQLEATSEGRPYLRHWGVLVTDMAVVDVKVLLQTTNGVNQRVSPGTMYQQQGRYIRRQRLHFTEVEGRMALSYCRFE